MSKPTIEQIKVETAVLKEIRPRVPHRSTFGKDNWAAIQAQTAILEERLNEDAIYNRYTDNQYALDSALDALGWREGDPDFEAPSDDWKNVVE